MSVVTVKDLKRRDGYYYLPPRTDGGERKYPSVTTILGVLAKPALIAWAAKTAASLVFEDPDRYDTAEKAAAGIYAKRDKAANRGSTVHSLAEALDLGGEVGEVPEEFSGYWRAYRDWAAAFKPQVLFTEATVYSDTDQYAGTLDLICLGQDGKTWLIDRKTSSGIYPEMSLQVEAYRKAEWILPREGDPQRMPEIDVTAILLLGADGSPTFKAVFGNYDAFLAAKVLWKWTKGVS